MNTTDYRTHTESTVKKEAIPVCCSINSGYVNCKNPISCSLKSQCGFVFDKFLENRKEG